MSDLYDYFSLEREWSDSMVGDWCDSESSSWELAAGVGAGEGEYTDPDEITYNGSKRVQGSMYFTDRPDTMLDPNCSYYDIYDAEPENFEIVLEPGSLNDVDNLYFDGAHPEDGAGENHSSNPIGTVLDIVAAATKPQFAVPAVLINYLLQDGGNSVSVSEIGDDGKLEFDIDVDGDYDDLPREVGNELEVAGVSGRLHMGYLPEDSPRTTLMMPNYSFKNWQHPPEGCNTCQSYSPVAKFKTTSPAGPFYAFFDSGDP